MKRFSKIVFFSALSAVIASGTVVYADGEPPAPAEPTSAPYIVTFKAGTTVEQQAASLSIDGASETDSIPQLRMHAVELVDGSDALAVLQDDPAVARVDADRTRGADAVPSDPSYTDQWSLD